MVKYKLSDFGLKKQCLKRKLKEVKDPKRKKKLKLILNQRTTKFDLKTIEYIVNGFYSNLKSNSNQPLSVYYAKQNRKKYENIKTLIEIKKYGSIVYSLKKDVKNAVNNSHENILTYEEFDKDLNDLAKKYKVTINEIYELSNNLENNWLNKIMEKI